MNQQSDDNSSDKRARAECQLADEPNKTTMLRKTYSILDQAITEKVGSEKSTSQKESDNKFDIGSESTSEEEEEQTATETTTFNESVAVQTTLGKKRPITSKKPAKNPKRPRQTTPELNDPLPTDNPSLFESEAELEQVSLAHKKRTNPGYDKNNPLRHEVRKSTRAALTPLEIEVLSLQATTREPVEGIQQSGEVMKSRQRYNQIALQLRLPSLWEPDGPLSKHNCLWPCYNAIDSDVSLVRFDFFIDYLYNMFLIGHKGTSHERRNLLCNYNTPAHEQKTLQGMEESQEGYDYEINKDTIPCASMPYRFDEKRFKPVRDQSVQIEVAAPISNIADIMHRQMRKQPGEKRKRDDTATISQDSENDDDKQMPISKTFESKANHEELSLRDIGKFIDIPVTIYEHLFITQYEVEHPHSMTALQQKLFIGRLNGMEMKYTQQQIKTLPGCVAAARAFGLGSFDRPTGWSAKYIMMMGKTMHEYIMAMFSRLREKALGEFVTIYGEVHAKSLHSFYMSKLRKLNYQIEQYVRLLCMNCTLFQQDAEPSVPEHPSILSQAILGPHFTDEEVYAKTNSFQKVLMDTHFYCQQERLRKFDGVAYKEVITENGYRTNAFKVFCDIDELCNKAPNLVTQGSKWLISTEKPAIPGWVANYMKVTDTEYFFPWLKRQQWVWSFRNGIYDGEQDRFWKYDDPQIRQSRLSPYNRKEGSAKYIDKDFDLSLMNEDMKADPSLIKVEPVEQICDSQNFSQAVRSWIWALSGRVYFPVGMRDNWQVVLWFKGVAGTGKSTMIHAIRSVYDPNDVGIMANNIEPQFGLMGFRHNFLLVAGEVKTSFSLDSALFQTMASGDEISIARKNLAPLSLPAWTIPSVYASNVYPRWVDSSGSIQRRVMSVIFSVAVKKQTGDLKEKIAEKIDAFIVRACRSYQKKLDQVGNNNVWDYVPDEFNVARKDVGRQTTELVRFLDEYLVLSEEPSEDLQMQDKIDVMELERLYLNRRQTGTERNFRFVEQLETDIGSFHGLRVTREPFTKRQVICKCRLNLQRVREVRGDPSWKPQMCSFYTQEELIAFEAAKTALPK